MMNFKDGYTPKGMYRFPFKMEMPLDIPASLAMSHKKRWIRPNYLRAQGSDPSNWQKEIYGKWGSFPLRLHETVNNAAHANLASLKQASATEETRRRQVLWEGLWQVHWYLSCVSSLLVLHKTSSHIRLASSEEDRILYWRGCCRRCHLWQRFI